MTYKALIFDFDGTAIHNGQFERPTQKVIEAVNKAKERLIVCGATGRPISTARWIFQDLSLTFPSIISAGTKIVSPATEEILWEVTLKQEKVDEVLATAQKYPYQTITESQLITFPPQPERVKQDECVIYIVEVPKQESKNILDELKTIQDISIHLVKGYNSNHIDIHITHKEGSKEHALSKLKELLNIKTEEIIGVGDSFNDIPLLNAVGCKVAMGNAAEELKSIADYIAPSVEEDGLADVIEKFVL